MSATPIGAVRYFIRDPLTDLPLPGAKLWTYEAGTTTPQDTWADAAKAGTNTNPVIMDADGGALVYIDGLYKFIATRDDDTLLYEVDDIIGGTTAFDRPASGVTSLPFDDITAVNVQDALEEIAQKRVKDTDIIDTAHGGTGGTTPAEARDNLGLEIGVDVQAYDADLQLIASTGLSMFKGYLYDCTLANNGSDATNDIDIAAGVTFDDITLKFITVAAMTKRLDANWSAGTGNGMRYSGAAITNTTYHLWAVSTAGGTQDIYADPSAVRATVLGHLQAETGGASYVNARRIGSIVRAGGTIRPFKQLGDEFTWDVPASDFNAGIGSTAVTITLTVPTGVVVQARMNVAMQFGNVSGGDKFMLLTALDQPNTAPSATAFTVAGYMDGAIDGGSSGGYAVIKTNTSGQIRGRDGVVNDFTSRIVTYGYIDTRGRLAA